MTMLKKCMIPAMTTLTVLFALSGCAGGQDSTGTAKAPASNSNEPVHLVMYQQIAGISDTEFKEYIADPVNKKYPYITIELSRAPSGDEGRLQRESLVASGSFPDMVFTNDKSINTFADLNVPIDFNEFAKKENVDLSRFDPGAMDDNKKFSGNGKLYAIPFSVNYSALFYNKNIFDKFGVPYPREGMNWDQTIELAKKLTREDAGFNYYGLDAGPVFKFGSPLSLPFVDPQTGKAALNTEKWHEVLALGQKMGPMLKSNFLKDQNVAMKAEVIDQISGLADLQKNGTAFPWDLTTYPYYPENPGVGLVAASHVILISSTSKQQDAAFKVLSVVTSDEVQLAMTKNARVSSLKDPKFHIPFGENLEVLKGKNVQAIFKSKRAPIPIPTKYDQQVQNRLNNAMLEVWSGKKDINSALRDAEELATQDIAAIDAK